MHVQPRVKLEYATSRSISQVSVRGDIGPSKGAVSPTACRPMQHHTSLEEMERRDRRKFVRGEAPAHAHADHDEDQDNLKGGGVWVLIFADPKIQRQRRQTEGADRGVLRESCVWESGEVAAHTVKHREVSPSKGRPGAPCRG